MTDETDVSTERPKTPIWFWIVGVVALIWNSFGAVDYTLTQMGNEAYLAAFTEEQLAFYLGFPVWYEAVWAIAVWTAVLGSLALLIRSNYAAPVFLVVWCQEEPKNMGAWSFVEPYLEFCLEKSDTKSTRARYAGRAASASTATGLLSKHQAQQAALIDEALS